MNKYHLLYILCFGFRKEHSTQHALITLIDNITQVLDEGSMLIRVFLDLKKAFNCIDHSIIRRKLYAYGIRVNSSVHVLKR